jgi:hypothetical protein
MSEEDGRESLQWVEQKLRRLKSDLLTESRDEVGLEISEEIELLEEAEEIVKAAVIATRAARRQKEEEAAKAAPPQPGATSEGDAAVARKAVRVQKLGFLGRAPIDSTSDNEGKTPKPDSGFE